MQTQKKRIEIITESVTLLIVRKSTAGARESWCERCRAEVFWIKPTALKLFGISDLPEIGAVHTNGDEFCSRSLIDQIKMEKNYEK